MNVVIMQPFYLFLRKHFHLVQRADLYVFMDTAQFVKGGHHNRNRIKGPEGYQWLTLPIVKKGKFGQTIKEAELNYNVDWRDKHWKAIQFAYAKAPYFKTYADFFEDVYKQDWKTLADINIYLIEKISEFMGIKDTKYVRLSDVEFEETENPTQRLINICEAVGATNYIIGTRAKDYLEEELWEKTNVNLEFYEPQYDPYPQLWGQFLDHCAIIDLLLNCGPESGDYIWGKHFSGKALS